MIHCNDKDLYDIYVIADNCTDKTKEPANVMFTGFSLAEKEGFEPSMCY